MGGGPQVNIFADDCHQFYRYKKLGGGGGNGWIKVKIASFLIIDYNLDFLYTITSVVSARF